MSPRLPRGYSLDLAADRALPSFPVRSYGDRRPRAHPRLAFRDRKFPDSFDVVFAAEGARVILTPLRAPKANAHAERWIGSCRRECLDWLLILSERQLQAVLDIYSRHYNQEWPHGSRQLRPPASRGDPPVFGGGPVRRRVQLGGLFSEYAREAA